MTSAFRTGFLCLPAAIILASSSCVTVNVNFPESTIQKAADDYVRDLYRAKKKEPESTTPQTLLEKGLRWDLIPSANAEDDIFNVHTPKAEEIKARQAERVDKIIQFKRQGLLGETNDGLLTIRGAEGSKKLMLKTLEAIVTDENRDRRDLYNEIMKANKLPDHRRKSVENSFSRAFQGESPSKTWLQESDGKWAQKP